MRVLLPDGEEKGPDPRFSPPAAENSSSAAGLALSHQQQHPARSSTLPLPARTPSAEAPPDLQPSATNGKQRPATVARPGVSEPSTDNDVGVEGDVKDDGRDVDGKSSTATTAPDGKRAAAGTSACDVA